MHTSNLENSSIRGVRAYWQRDFELAAGLADVFFDQYQKEDVTEVAKPCLWVSLEEIVNQTCPSTFWI